MIKVDVMVWLIITSLLTLGDPHGSNNNHLRSGKDCSHGEKKTMTIRRKRTVQSLKFC